MTAASLLAQLQGIGANLRVKGDRLLIDAPKGAITPELRQQLASRKPELMALLAQAPRQSVPDAESIHAESLDGDLPLSYAQQRMWLLQEIDAADGAYNIPVAARVTGPLDVDLLKACLDRIVRRHAALRTVVDARRGRPVARVVDAAPVDLPVTDLSERSEMQREQEVERIRREEALREFDLAHGPLLAARVLRLGPQEHVLLITLHHIVCDGWSLGVLLRELGELYGAAVEGRQASLPDLAIQYPDYARWQADWLAGERLSGQLEYWREALRGDLPVLELPTRGPRPAVQTFCGGVHRVELSADLVASVERLGRAEGGTLFMVLLAAYAAVLSRYSGQQDVVVGTPIAGRTRPELEGLIGLFVNTLALRMDVSGGPTLRELLGRARTVAMDAYAHQDAPFEKLVEVLQPQRDMSRSPLFQAMLILQNAPLPRMRLGSASVAVLPDGGQVAKFDLTLEVQQEAGRTVAAWNYNRDLLDPRLVERMAGQFEALLRGAIAEPDRPISELAMLSPAERSAIAAGLNRTDRAREDLAGAGTGRVAPRMATQRTLAGIWTDVLLVDDIGAEDDFFRLGGHSLLAAQVVARIRETFEIDLPLRTMFETPTLGGLAGAVEKRLQDRTQASVPPIETTDRAGDLPLSFGQQRLWFLEQLEPGTPLYNVPLAVRLEGALDADALARAINEVVPRHESLRTVFGPGEGEGCQRVLGSLTVDLPVEDLSGLPTERCDAQVRERIEQEASEPFDLVAGPLLRARLLRLGAGEHVLLLTMHHIVCDGWSTGVLLRETASLYEALVEGAPAALPALPVQYGDYAAWQRSWLTGETLSRQVEYWRSRLGDDLPVLDLPTDRPRPAEQTYAGATVSFQIRPETVAALERLARAEGATLFMTLLTSFAVLLSRHSGQDEVVIGTPVAGRRDARTEGLIGFFVNMLPLRVDLRGQPLVREALRRVREVSLEAQAHQDVPFEKLVDELHVRRDTSRTPIFQVVLAMQNMPLGAMQLGEVEMSPLPEPGNVAKFDLMLTVQPAGQGLAASLNYNRDLFDEGTIGRMVRRFQDLLNAIAAGADAAVSDLAMLTADERRQLDDWGRADGEYPRDACVHELFEKQVRLCGDAVAIVAGGKTLTYWQLDEQANAWAQRLIECGVELETPVGLCTERSAEMVVAMLAILKAGGAYVPLDPALPAERLRLLIGDTGARVVLAQGRFVERLEGLAPQVLCLDDSLPPQVLGPTRPVTAGSLAYVMYTSGSAGTPKGVAIEHCGIVRLVKGTNYARLDADQVFLQLAPFSFDASTLEIWGPLLNGGRLVIPPPGMPSLAELSAMIRRHGVTVLWLTAGLFHQIVDEDVALLDAVPQVLAGGDVLSVPHVRRVLERRNGGVLVNGYGPTESTTFTCCCRLHGPEDIAQTVPIGRPVANTSVYVLDRRMQPVPVGVVGELYIGGDGLARGYVNAPALTAEKFVPNPFARQAGERLYRTGDLVRYLAAGRIEFVGRTDLQVKVRGYRIEPGEIEAALVDHPDVREAAVVARTDGGTGKRLVAYVVPQPGREPAPDDLRRFLQSRLAEYMVPAAFVLLEALPLTPNGKVDRAALPVPAPVQAATQKDAALPATPVESALARIWAQVLRVERVGAHDNFFELGGDSILCLQVVSRAQRAGIRITTRQVFQYQTVAELAAVAEESGGMAAAEVAEKGEVPLLPAQRWFFELDPPAPEHWNQSVMLRVAGELNWQALCEALAAVVARHGALRLRFAREGGAWRQRIVPADGAAPAERIDVADVSDGELPEVLAAHAERMQTGLDLQNGPLLRVAWFDCGASRAGRLLIVVHHLAVDGVSWRILLEDLQTAYVDAAAGRPIALPSPATSLAAWSRWLGARARSGALDAQRDWWLSRPPATDLPADWPDGANVEEFAERVSIELTVQETESLLREVPQAYHTQIDEVLLTALARVLRDWTGSQRVSVELEGHGRQSTELDLSRTVGWLTSMYPVDLEVPGSAGPGEALCAVKEQLRAVPDRGEGYGLLRYLADDETAGALARIAPPQIRFNYLGQFDQVLGAEGLPLAPADESAGVEHDPRCRRSHWLEVNAAVAADRLRVDWVYSRNIHRRETVERLAQQFIDGLRDLIGHCVSPEAGGVTPSDFPLAGLDQTQMANLAAMLGRKKQ